MSITFAGLVVATKDVWLPPLKRDSETSTGL